MGPLALLGFASLCAGLGRAEVVKDFTTCKQFFYGEKPPQGFDTAHAADICQTYDEEPYFATFYNTRGRIPVWSAYTLDPNLCPETPSKTWKVEPQLSGLRTKNMEEEGGRADTLKKKQAVDEDYRSTGYDRGHLNPNAFQCDGRAATFTLTNAVPMDPCFNRLRWFELEKNLKAKLDSRCVAPAGNAFLVTGVVPGNQQKIPIKDHDNRRGIRRDAARVAVPSHVWTAVCCDNTDNNEKFAFAFLADNSPKSTLQSMTVAQLAKKLKELYRGNQDIRIFKDGCNEDSAKARDVLTAITNNLCRDHPNWVTQACAQDEPRAEKRRKIG